MNEGSNVGGGDRQTALGWLREPPAADEVRVAVECGDGAELSPGARDALEQLMAELHDAEVAGYALDVDSFGESFGVFRVFSPYSHKCGKRSH